MRIRARKKPTVLSDNVGKTTSRQKLDEISEIKREDVNVLFMMAHDKMGEDCSESFHHRLSAVRQWFGSTVDHCELASRWVAAKAVTVEAFDVMSSTDVLFHNSQDFAKGFVCTFGLSLIAGQNSSRVSSVVSGDAVRLSYWQVRSVISGLRWSGLYFEENIVALLIQFLSCKGKVN